MPAGEVNKRRALPLMKTRDFWKAKLVAAMKEVGELQRVLAPRHDPAPTPVAEQHLAVFICYRRERSQEKRWHAWLKQVRERRKLRQRLAMLLKTKIPYYEARIAARTNRTSFDVIQNPPV